MTLIMRKKGTSLSLFNLRGVLCKKMGNSRACLRVNLKRCAKNNTQFCKLLTQDFYSFCHEPHTNFLVVSCCVKLLVWHVKLTPSSTFDWALGKDKNFDSSQGNFCWPSSLIFSCSKIFMRFQCCWPWIMMSRVHCKKCHTPARASFLSKNFQISRNLHHNRNSCQRLDFVQSA